VGSTSLKRLADQCVEEQQEDQMNTVENSIEIRRPVEVVFAYVADARHNPQWQGTCKEVQVPDGPVTIGTKVTFVRSFLG
jgi:uncharacterized membrane protein